MAGLAEILDQNQLLRDMVAAEKAAREAQEVALREQNVRLRAVEAENARLRQQKAEDDAKIAALIAAAEDAARLLARLRAAEKAARSERVADTTQALLPFLGGDQAPPRDPVLKAFEPDPADRDPDDRTKKHPSAKRRSVKGLALHQVEETLGLPDAAACPACAGPLKQLGTDVSYRVDWLPGCFVKRQISRPKCACPSCPEQGVIAPSLPHLLPNALCANGLLARVVVDKFADHLPLNRQAARMAREGFEIDSKVLSAWVANGAARLRPLVRAVIAEILSATVLQGDDTRLPVQDGTDGKLRNGRLWVFTDQQQAFYAFTDSKAGEHPEAILATFTGHTLLVDGGSEFNRVVGQLGLDRAGCWSHARRYFYEAREESPSHAIAAVGTIRDLFLIEREIAALPVADRARIRTTRSAPLVDGLVAWAEKLAPTTRPGSGLGEAVTYLLNQRGPLRTFLDEPALPIHNNLSELMLRSPVVGRKNWLFAGSEGGAQAAVAWYTLIASARLQAIDPHAYLLDVMGRLEDHPANRLSELTPRGWREARDARLTGA